jgi:glycerol uptake facilitator protein
MQTSNFIGELLGTLVLILLGDGVVANVLLKGSKGENGGWIVITAGWAFAVMGGVFIAQKFGSPDAHLNPAITIAMAFKSGDYSNVLPFISAQLIGAYICLIGQLPKIKELNWVFLPQHLPSEIQPPMLLPKLSAQWF